MKEILKFLAHKGVGALRSDSVPIDEWVSELMVQARLKQL